MTKNGEKMKGVLTFHSETGTEGGYWAFQDERHISLEWLCQKCGAYLGSDKDKLKRNSHIANLCAPASHIPKQGSVWSYDGLHLLRTGDKLTIHSKDDPNMVLWSGTINLKQHPAFTEDARGWWIHSDQIGMDRAVWAEWFFKQNPAVLTPANEKQ